MFLKAKIRTALGEYPEGFPAGESLTLTWDFTGSSLLAGHSGPEGQEGIIRLVVSAKFKMDVVSQKVANWVALTREGRSFPYHSYGFHFD